jgi:hypothetical protein
MKRVLVSAAAVALMVGGLAAPAYADSGADVEGPCSAGRSEWRLRVDPNDGILEVRFKVNQHRPSDAAWDVVVTQNGATVFSGTRVGRGGDGQFEVRRKLADTAGDDTIAGTATNRSTGVVCEGQATV